MEIRYASVRDAEEILAIYAPYVENTAVTFEYEAPDLESFRGRIAGITERYPYLAAVEDGRIIGYAYASPFHTRAAYQHSAEASIYLDMGRRRRGVGRLLYRELEKALLRQNVFVLYAGITSTDRKDDAFLSDASLRFHEKTGFTPVGTCQLCGYKFGRWYSVTWMGKELAPRPEKPDPFIPFSALAPAREDQSAQHSFFELPSR